MQDFIKWLGSKKWPFLPPCVGRVLSLWWTASPPQLKTTPTHTHTSALAKEDMQLFIFAITWACVHQRYASDVSRIHRFIRVHKYKQKSRAQNTRQIPCDSLPTGASSGYLHAGLDLGSISADSSRWHTWPPRSSNYFNYSCIFFSWEMFSSSTSRRLLLCVYHNSPFFPWRLLCWPQLTNFSSSCQHRKWRINPNPGEDSVHTSDEPLHSSLAAATLFIPKQGPVI